MGGVMLFCCTNSHHYYYIRCQKNNTVELYTQSHYSPYDALLPRSTIIIKNLFYYILLDFVGHYNNDNNHV